MKHINTKWRSWSVSLIWSKVKPIFFDTFDSSIVPTICSGAYISRSGDFRADNYSDHITHSRRAMALVKRRSGYFKSSPWVNRIPRHIAEGPPFGEGLSLTEKMYAQKFEKSESGWSQCNLKYAAYAMQGFRKHMQDDYQCVPNYTIGSSREPSASFAVFDGHGLRGHCVSSLCAETFLGSVYGRKAVRTRHHWPDEKEYPQDICQIWSTAPWWVSAVSVCAWWCHVFLIIWIEPILTAV